MNELEFQRYINKAIKAFPALRFFESMDSPEHRAAVHKWYEEWFAPLQTNKSN